MRAFCFCRERIEQNALRSAELGDLVSGYDLTPFFPNTPGESFGQTVSSAGPRQWPLDPRVLAGHAGNGIDPVSISYQAEKIGSTPIAIPPRLAMVLSKCAAEFGASLSAQRCMQHVKCRFCRIQFQ
jgi:hypothetical protein